MIQLTPSADHARRIVAILVASITEIIQDPFGNYAITTALEVSFLEVMTCIALGQEGVRQAYHGEDQGVLPAVRHPEVLVQRD